MRSQKQVTFSHQENNRLVFEMRHITNGINLVELEWGYTISVKGAESLSATYQTRGAGHHCLDRLRSHDSVEFVFIPGVQEMEAQVG